MEFFGLILLVGFVYVCWRETKLSQLRSAASTAILACEEEILRLRGGIMAGRTLDGWQSEVLERKRGDLLVSLERFHAAADHKGYDQALIASSVPSFQDPSEWEKFQILGRGPFLSSEPSPR